MILNNCAANRCLLILVVCFSALSSYSQPADEAAQQGNEQYMIGPGDLLSIKFWQKPELNVDVRVSAAGFIEIPLVGSLEVKGYTPGQLGYRIASRISLIDVTYGQVSVQIKEYGSKTVYVTGGVLTPGKYNFEIVPNVWQVILEAGGPTATAMLDNVSIIRGEANKEGEGRIVNVNIARALQDGDINSLPKIYPGDTIQIPSMSTNQEGRPTTISSPLQQQNVVYVWGAVKNPGILHLQDDMDLMRALVLAGGTTPEANLKKVRVIFGGRSQSELAVVDMQGYLNHSHPKPLTLNAGDAIYVPQRSIIFRDMGQIWWYVLSIAATFIIYRS